MIEAVALGKFDLDTEQFAQAGRGEQAGLGAVGEDAALAHHDHAIDLGQDVGEMMRDQKNAGSLLRQTAQGVPQLPLRGQVEGVAGLIEQKNPRAMDESAADENALGFPGRHLPDGLGAEMFDFKPAKNFFSAIDHFTRDAKVWPQGGARKKSGDDGVAAQGVRGAFAGKLGGDDTEMTAQLGEVPAFAAEDAEVRAFPDERISLAGEGLDQGRFAAAVGAKDSDVLSRPDAERDIVQHDGVAAGDKNILHFNKCW